jgi:2-polyprenyl-3-methyl-5-hydroxy-6-metoxy-1,4-benzoquinol methylase|tara:strand:+ start:223 stop:1068 length:846 start_codon:yes stop_codon:yes gene_type:complete
MNKSYANLEVLNFYQKLPFNYYKNVDTAAGSITKTNSLLYYPVLPPILNHGIKVLDVGCGVGWLVNGINFHYKKYGSSASGIDYNSVAIKQAQEIASRLGIKSDFIESDLFEFQPSEPYGLVTSVGVLHHTNNCIEGLLHIFRHCIRRGGYAFIGLYHKYGRKPFLDHFNDLKRQGLSEEKLLKEFMKLRSGSGDKLHDLSWFYDQVLHPHETQHTLKELIPVLHSENMELISSSINKFESFKTEDELIEKEKSYYTLATKKLRDKIYFPGFFVFLAKKRA